MHQAAFYLLAYHLVLSGVLKYNEYNGNIPSIPILTELLFGIPFVLYLVKYLAGMFLQPFSLRYHWRTMLFSGALLYMVWIVVYNQLTRPLDFAVFSFNAIILMWYFISFLIGLHLPIQLSERGRKAALFFYLILVLNIFFNYKFGSQRITFDKDHLGISLFLGDSFALWSLYTIAQYNKRFVSIIMVFVSLGCLYVITSRSSLYGFMCIVPLIFRKTKNGWIQLTFIAAIVALITIFIVYGQSLKNSYMLNFLFTGDDHSFYMRKLIMQNNFEDVMKYWFLGDYAGQLKYGVLGLYIHNYLSFWRQFGIIPFVIFIGLLLPFLAWFIPWFRGKKYQQYDFLFYLILFLLIEMIFTRSYKSHFIWIAIGAMTNLLNERSRLRGIEKSTKEDST